LVKVMCPHSRGDASLIEVTRAGLQVLEGDNVSAEATCQKLWRISPFADLDPHFPYLYGAVAALRMQKYEHAHELAVIAMSIAPYDFPSLRYAALSAYESDRQLAAAHYLSLVVARYPRRPFAARLLMHMALLNGDRDTAEEIWSGTPYASKTEQ